MTPWPPLKSGLLSGARRLAQLEDNVQALEMKLSHEELAHLAVKTKPALGFPANMQPMFPDIHNGGTTVNGVYGEPSSSFVLLRARSLTGRAEFC